MQNKFKPLIRKIVFAQCTKVLGRYKGVCKDLVVGGNDDIQFHTTSRADGINTITYRRSLISCKTKQIYFEIKLTPNLQLITETKHFLEKKVGQFM